MLLEQDGKRLAGNIAPMPPTTGILTLPMPGTRGRRAILGVGAYLVPGIFVFSGSDLHRARLAGRQIIRTLVG